MTAVIRTDALTKKYRRVAKPLTTSISKSRKAPSTLSFGQNGAGKNHCHQSPP